MIDFAPLTKNEVSEMVLAWYEALDVHAPMVDFLWMVSEDDLEMRFPEATLTSRAEFESWYQGVIRIFFDEVHTMKELNIKISEDGATADIDLVVYWEASVWNPPDRFSKRLMMDAYQTWVVNRSVKSGKPVIVKYVVDKLDLKEGSASL
jgi:hypothetical protein